jgi:hypothetical protein
MSKETAAQNNTQAVQKKKIHRRKGQPTRLWVRAKFLGFRRYYCSYLDHLLIKTKIKLFLESKELEIELILIGISERELFMLLNMEARISQPFGEELLPVMVMEEPFLLDSPKTYHQRLLDQL